MWWIHAIDVILFAILLYVFYSLIKGTVAFRILIGFLALYPLSWLANRYQMILMGNLLKGVTQYGVILAFILFQPEIRKFFIYIFSEDWLGGINRKKLLQFASREGNEFPDLNEIIQGCFRMAATRTGALIIVCRKNDLREIVSTGVRIDAKVSALLLENIFYKNSPLHDGAVIIRGNIITAARCILPVSERENLPAEWGMRHRSALGVTEISDAIAITVSEQSGKISLFRKGLHIENITKEQLYTQMKKYLTIEE